MFALPKQPAKGAALALSLVFVAISAYLMLGVDRANFPLLIFGFALLFSAYLVLMLRPSWLSVKQMIILAVLLRLIPFFGPPTLSDDYHRFLWDGQLSVHGENPYLHLPEDLQEAASQGRYGLSESHYDALNSKNYYTVYPPLNQAFFCLAAWVGGSNEQLGLWVLQLLVLVGELLLLMLLGALLGRMALPREHLAWYALNPLVIVEVSGNVHFEGWVLTCLAASAYFMFRANGKKSSRSALGFELLAGCAFGAAVLIKLTPLMLGPLILVCFGLRRPLVSFGLAAAVTFAVGFLPFLSDAQKMVLHVQDSLGLYVRTFEFNASVYYMVRYAGMQVLGYNPIAVIGPALSVLTFLGIVGLAIAAVKTQVSGIRAVARYALYTYALYFFLATTVHPWYIVTLVGLTVFVRSWWVLAWSFLVLFSYSHYWGGGFQEHYLWIASEYLLLAVAIYLDFRSKKPQSRQPSELLTV